MMTRPRPLAIRPAWLLLAAVGCLARPVAAEAAEEALRWKLKAGESLRYELHQKNEIKIKAGGNLATDSTTESTFELIWVVKSVDDEGKADVTLAVSRVRSEIRTGSKTIRIDTKEEPGDGDQARADVKPEEAVARGLRAAYGRVVAAKSSLTLDARGRVIAASVPDDVAEALRRSPFAAMADSGSVFTGPGIKSMFGQLLPALPETPVEPGASWTSNLDLPADPLTLGLTFRDALEAAGADRATIAGPVEVTVKADPGATIAIEMNKQTGRRQVAFDIARGRVAASNLKVAMDLTLKFMNREIGQTSTIEVDLKLIP